MIFKSIRLKNFRQYSEEFKIDFPTPVNNTNNITLLMAENGVGKTTLLQSVRYCFYGSSSNYLKLPDKNNLVNNNLVNALKESGIDTMYVEVEFEHDNKTYIAIREQSFVKEYGKISPLSNELFTLKVNDNNRGFVEINRDHAMDKMRSILPDGLSYTFMFDGERMERNITDNEFKKDLDESIMGILNIKQYDELIKLLGDKNKTTTVIGRINSRKKGDTQDDQQLIDKNRRYEEKLDNLKDELAVLEERIKNIEIEININKEKQKEFEDLKIERLKLDSYISDYDKLELEIEEESKTNSQIMLWNLKNVILNKYKDDFERFKLKKTKNNIFYKNLHVDTLESILTSLTCLCGDNIGDDQIKLERIEELKKTALPFEIAHHMTNVDEKFVQANDVDFENLDEIQSQLFSKRDELDKKNIKIVKQKELLERLSSAHKIDYQEVINKLEKELNEKIGDRAIINKDIERILKILKINEPKIKMIDNLSEQNKKINYLIKELEEIKKMLEFERDTQNRKARKLLEYHFKTSLSMVLEGEYNAIIDEKYNITIYDKNNHDITRALSTGQNVIISLSMINALIETAKEFSGDEYNKFGIIMDAALSNLDQTHIYRVTKYNLTNIDQLIFLSFKKQLRDEMIDGIYNHVGKAYELYLKPGITGVYKKEIPKTMIKEHIAQSEDE